MWYRDDPRSCRILALLVAVPLLACTPATPQGTDTADPDAYDEECTGTPGTGVVFEYSEAWIVDPLEPKSPKSSAHV